MLPIDSVFKNKFVELKNGFYKFKDYIDYYGIMKKASDTQKYLVIKEYNLY